MRRWSDPSCTLRTAIFFAICLIFGFTILDTHDWRDVAIRWKQISSPLNSSFLFPEPQILSEIHHVNRALPPGSSLTATNTEEEEGENGSTIPDSGGSPESSSLRGSAVPEIEKEEAFGPSTPHGLSTNGLYATPILDGNGSPGPSLEEDDTFRLAAPILVPSAAPTAATVAPEKLTSLQKIERSLSKARASILQVLKTGKSEKTKRGDYVPAGNSYRNAVFFRQSYYEMEKRFKIFPYEEGEEPLVHNGPCKEIYAIEGRFIQELQGDNPFLTSDPEKAHVFFLPFSVAMMVTYLYRSESYDFSPLQRFVKDYVHVIKQRHPFWNQSSGADHFMLTCHDWGPHISRVDRELEQNAIRVICNANSSEGYVPKKDVSLPEINLVGGRIPVQLGGPSLEERNYLAFFSGAEHGPVRPVLFEHWEGKDPDVQVFRSQNFPKDKSYHDVMKHTKFCLCPGGYEVNSPRIVEAIYNDCVPVIIADHFVLPFSDILNWNSFSIHLAEREIPQLKEVLEKIPADVYRAMQENVRRVQRHFLFNQPPQRYDVFHMILHSVWLRRLNIQIQSI